MTTERPIIAVWAEGMTKTGDIVIGSSETNGLPWPHTPEDLHHFRETTRNHVLVMGRRTFDSLPDILKTEASTRERPLIVVTREHGSDIIEATPGNLNVQPISPGSVDRIPTHALAIADKWPSKPVAVIGGSAIIEAFESYLTGLVVTLHPGSRTEGDVLAPRDVFFESFYVTDHTRLSDTVPAVTAYRYARKEAA